MTDYNSIRLVGKVNTRGKFSTSTSGLDFTSDKGDKQVHVDFSDIVELHWTTLRDGQQLKVRCKGGVVAKFQGFQPSHLAGLEDFFKELNKTIKKVAYSTKGYNWGTFDFEETSLTFNVDKQMHLELPLASISQAVHQGKNEMAIEFHQDDTHNQNAEVMMEMRVWVPPSEVGDDDDEGDPQEGLKAFLKQIVDKADIGTDAFEKIATFQEVPLQVPRGKYNLEVFHSFFKLQGQSFSYKILYKSIHRMFLLEATDQTHHIFIIGLDPPIRQGRTAYPYLIMQFKSAQEIDLELNISEDTIEAKYEGLLLKHMSGPIHDIISRVFKAFTSKKVVVPGSFVSAHGYKAVRCSCKANEGYLYVLEKSFFFIKRPALFIQHDAILSIEFARLGGGSSDVTKTFDLIINMRSEKHTFTSINKNEYNNMFEFIARKKLNILNIKQQRKILEIGGSSTRGRGRTVNPDDPYLAQLMAEQSDEDSEDDSDFEIGEDEGEDADEYEEFSQDSGSDSEYQGEGEKPTKKRKQRSDTDFSDSPASDNDSGNADSDSDVAPRKKKPKAKRASSPKKAKARPKKKKKKGPKNALSAYMYFNKEQRPLLKEANPELSFGELGKLIGVKWKELSDEDRAPYTEMAAKDKERYVAEKAEFVPSEGESSDGSSKKKKGKGKKKKGLPKRALSSYMFFSKANRGKLKEANPDLSFGDLGKKVGEAWKALSTEDKQLYVDQNTEDKVRHAEEMEVWKEKMKNEPASESESEAPPVSPKKKKKKKKKDEADDDDDDDDSSAGLSKEERKKKKKEKKKAKKAAKKAKKEAKKKKKAKKKKGEGENSEKIDMESSASEDEKIDKVKEEDDADDKTMKEDEETKQSEAKDSSVKMEDTSDKEGDGSD